MIAEPEFCVRVCETLLHSLWQGAAIAAAALVAGRLMRHRSAQARYGLFVMALGIVALCPAATFWWLGPDSIAPASTRPETRATAQADAVAPVALPSAANASAAAASPAVATPAATNEFTLRQYAPHFVTVYAVGVVAMIAHLLFALRGGVRLRRKSLKIEDLALVDSLSRAARVIGLPFVPALAWCERVGAPTVVGIVRPAILIPLSLANGLSPEQVELLLMHELAHLKRHDHWVNLAQRLIESLYFFNPAIWIISRRIRIERELACDDMVLGTGAKQSAYAGSLLRMAELSRGQTASALALGATASPLGRRILRIIGRPAHEQVKMNRVWPIAAAVALVFAFGVFSHVGNVWADGHNAKSNQKTNATLPWGKESNGLRAAFELVPAKKEYALGETVRVQFHIQNVSANPIELLVEDEWDHFWPTIKDESGNPAMFAGAWFYHQSGGGVRRILQPGETGVFKSYGFGFRSGLEPGSKNHLVGNLDSPPGKYSVSYTLRLSDKRTLQTGAVETAVNFPRVAKTPDNPLGLTDDLLKKLHVTGQGMRQIIAAMQAYQNDHNGSVPERIEDFGKYLPKIPKDPFNIAGNGIPFNLDYTKTTDTVRVYSCGPDEAYPFHVTPTGGALMMSLGERKPIDSADPFLKGDLAMEYNIATRKIRYLADETMTQYLKGERQGNSAANKETSARGELKKAETPATLAWGKEVNGLRAAFELIPAKNEYAIGDRLKLRFWVQNASDRAIQFTSTEPRQKDELTVRDVNGKKVAVRQIWHSGWPITERLTLGPGETSSIDSFAFGIGKETEKTEPGKLEVGYILDANPGKYFASFNLRFPDVIQTSARDPKENVPQPNDWQGTLVTGEVEIHVAEPAADASAATMIRHLIEVTVPSSCSQQFRQFSFHGLDLKDVPYSQDPPRLPDLFEEVPPGSNSFEMRKEVFCVFQTLDGSIFYVPSKSVYYLQHDMPGSGFMTFYGPFTGDPDFKPKPLALPAITDRQSWGEPVDGVRCRLRLDSNPAYKQFGPVFQLDIFSERVRTLPHYGHPINAYAVELDGVWYRRNERGKFTEMAASVGPSPGFQRDKIYFPLRPDFLCRADDSATTMSLQPGKHRIRVGFDFQNSDGKKLRAVSNPVEFEIPDESAEYKKEVRELESKGLSIAKQEGKEALIARYRTIIDKYPGREDNLLIETKIAAVYKWDIPEKNERSNMSKAFDIYQAAIKKFDDSNPHMKTVRYLAAETSSDIYPDQSSLLFQALLEKYPHDEVLRLKCLGQLGLNALKGHHNKKAEEYYSRVLAYDSGSNLPTDEISQIQTEQRNAAIGLFWTAFDKSDSAEQQLRSINAMLKKYPQIEMWHSDTVERVLQQLKDSMAANKEIREQRRNQ